MSEIEEEVKIILPDKYGRIMTRKKIEDRKTDYILLEKNEGKRTNRKPRKRPPLNIKKSFFDDQKPKFLID